ncbi:serine protease inhibitor Kazal-type 4 [Phascolarctos cinereus]|uniref:Serine protease inhibitor Kazal-type 4 n=1 Tax=Phascolarctos cinereus TaxID=38626 RepID=A0A6P5IPG7_PHACI|nr:serine protease inhibitor Kazal-type 4 [Phascolarctos cinereus]
MKVKMCMLILALVAIIGAWGKCGKQKKMVFRRMPLCEHVAEIPWCPKTYQPVCGTDEKTYNNECQMCIARIKTKQDIQITKDGVC